MINRIVGLHFSLRGGTEKITNRIVRELAEELGKQGVCDIKTETYSIADAVAVDETSVYFDGAEEGVSFDGNTIAVVAVPAIIGKIPVPAIMLMNQLQGAAAMTIGVVSYGTRSYGNALYELCNLSERQGFKLVGAAAFAIKHAGIRSTEMLRPDAEDMAALSEFCRQASNKLMRLSGSEIEGLRIKPAPINIDGCLPVHRISKYSPVAAFYAERLCERIDRTRREPEWIL